MKYGTKCKVDEARQESIIERSSGRENLNSDESNKIDSFNYT